MLSSLIFFRWVASLIAKNLNSSLVHINEQKVFKEIPPKCKLGSLDSDAYIAWVVFAVGFCDHD